MELTEPAEEMTPAEVLRSPERERMTSGLLVQFMAIVTVAVTGLWIRDLVTAPPARTAAVSAAVSAGALLVAYRKRSWAPRVGFAFFIALVLMIVKAAFDLGGAAASAPVFFFLPALLAMLTLGRREGWVVCGFTLASFAWLYFATPLDTQLDRLRFGDEILMTLFGAALGHTLTSSLDAYEAAIVGRRNALTELEARRVTMAHAIYEDLEPRVQRLVEAFEPSGGNGEPSVVDSTVSEVATSLRKAKGLTKPEAIESSPPDDRDAFIRQSTMRLWLRVGAVFVAFAMFRNAAAGVPFAPSLLSFAACFVFDRWLGHPRSRAFLESTALAIGVVATIPLIFHIRAYGSAASAPPLVVAPATVLFTALLSRGPAALFVAFLNLALLAWVSCGQALTTTEYRRLGDLGLIFFTLVFILRRVLKLRANYAETLHTQAESIVGAQRQYRRLAGTLFHDASNFLQALALYSIHGLDSEPSSGRSLSRRVQHLIGVSKRFLTRADLEVTLTPLTVREAYTLLDEAFRPLIQGKGLLFKLKGDETLRFLAEPHLLVESVLGNLVSNAIKFSKPGAEITLSAELSGADVCLCISDAGPGFPEEVLNHDHQADVLPSRSGSNGETGQGYGLGLAREHLERMGGRLRLANLPRAGAECLVFLKADSVQATSLPGPTNQPL